MSKTPTMCVIGAGLDATNMGVRVLAAGSVHFILHRFPEAKIVFVDYACQKVSHAIRHYGRDVVVELIPIRFSKKLYLPNNVALLLMVAVAARLIPGERLRARFLRLNRTLQSLVDADIVFSIAGGDSFSDIYGMARLIYVALPQILAIASGKRLVLLPQTIGPFRGGLARRIAAWILSRSELAYSRDKAGVDFIRSLAGCGAHGRFCFDVGFDVEAAPSPDLRVEGLGEAVEGGLVGLNVSGLLMSGGYTGDNMFGLRTGYKELVFAAVSYLIEQKHAAVLLVPHVDHSPKSRESDVAACELIFDELKGRFPGRIGIVRGKLEYAGIKHIIGGCDLFIGARMHACIGAISQHIPTLSIAYSEKFAGVMESIGCPDLVADPRSMTMDEIVSRIGDVYDRRSEVRQRLGAAMQKVVRTLRTALVGLEISRDRYAEHA